MKRAIFLTLVLCTFYIQCTTALAAINISDAVSANRPSYRSCDLNECRVFCTTQGLEISGCERGTCVCRPRSSCCVGDVCECKLK